MTDIWLVTCGDYSDYNVDSAFSTMEAADAHCARMQENYDNITWHVERVDLDPPLPEVVQKVIKETPKPVYEPMTPEMRQRLVDSIILERKGE
jgi:hypothetical protein